MASMSTETTRKGPLFDGTAARAATAYAEEISREVAQAGVNEIRSRLGQVLENPTGTYSGAIVTDTQQTDTVITDGGVVYGPWLEGVSTRNARSRFKGYATFRKTRLWLAGRAESIAQSKIGPYLSRMGGE